MWLQSCCGVKEDAMSINGFQAASEFSSFTDVLCVFHLHQNLKHVTRFKC